MEGWIKLHRKIQGHWLYNEKRTFSSMEAWIDILLNVNHTSSKFFIKGTLFEVQRGESMLSLESWGKRWNWNKSKVRRFLSLLEKDSMIELKSEQKTTRITVCNYDSYQYIGNAGETQTKHKRNAGETEMKHQRNTDETLATPNKNDKNIKNENNDKKEEESLAGGFDFFFEEFQKEKGMNPPEFTRISREYMMTEEEVKNHFIDWSKRKGSEKINGLSHAKNSFRLYLQLQKENRTPATKTKVRNVFEEIEIELRAKGEL